MSEHFTLVPLAEDAILQAYPLARAAVTDLSLEDWQRYAHTFMHRACDRSVRGMIGLRSSNAYIRGLFTYHVVPDLRCGRALLVEFFVVDTVFRPRPAALKLLAGVESAAREARCGCIRTDLATAPEWLPDLLRDRGYERAVEHLCKPVPAEEFRGGHGRPVVT